METTFKAKCEILSDLWVRYRHEPTLRDFFDYNDLSLPLAFLVAEQIVTEQTPAIKNFIQETFILFLTAVGVEDDGYETLDEILEIG